MGKAFMQGDLAPPIMYGYYCIESMLAPRRYSHMLFVSLMEISQESEITLTSVLFNLTTTNKPQRALTTPIDLSVI